MPAPVVLMLGGAALRVISKKVLELLVKRGAKKLTKKQVDKLKSPPKNVTVSNVANVLKQTRVAQPAKPRVPSGGSKPPVARANNSPASTRTSPNRPSSSGAGSKPNVPSTSARPKPSTSVGKPKTSNSGSNSSGPSRPMKDITPNKNAPSRPSGDRIVGMNPSAMRGPSLKLGTLDTAAPEVVVAPSDDKKPPLKKPPLKKTTTKQSDANKKAAETKKDAPTKTAPKKSPRPQKRPAAGPATNESFGKAFARNRKAGKATFKWKNKKYTTRYKEESIAQHKKKFGVEGKY